FTLSSSFLGSVLACRFSPFRPLLLPLFPLGLSPRKSRIVHKTVTFFCFFFDLFHFFIGVFNKRKLRQHSFLRQSSTHLAKPFNLFVYCPREVLCKGNR